MIICDTVKKDQISKIGFADYSHRTSSKNVVLVYMLDAMDILMYPHFCKLGFIIAS